MVIRFSPARNVQPGYIMDYGRANPIGTNNPLRSGVYGDSRTPLNGYVSPSSSITYVSGTTTSPFEPSSTVMSPVDPMDRSEPYYNDNGYSAETSSFSTGFNGGATNANGTYGAYTNRTTPPRDAGRLTPEYKIGEYMGSPTTSEVALGMPRTMNGAGNMDRIHTQQRRPINRDEFDGPAQFLPRPSAGYPAEQDQDLPHLPTNLVVQEQDTILSKVNDRLSRCAFDFVAKYEFPIPIDPSKRPVQRPEDREWTEWVYLLKRLATKRRIPARLLYNGQIKQFVTVLENSLEMRHAARNQSRPLKDDRNILQLISAGIQVAKIMKDAVAMDYLDRLYTGTESKLQERRVQNQNQMQISRFR